MLFAGVLIFSVGHLAVFSVFVMLYLHAYKKRNELELSTLEVFHTVSSVKENLLHCSIAIVSIAFVMIGGSHMAGLLGMIYAHRCGHGRSWLAHADSQKGFGKDDRDDTGA